MKCQHCEYVDQAVEWRHGEPTTKSVAGAHGRFWRTDTTARREILGTNPPMYDIVPVYVCPCCKIAFIT